MVNSKLSIFGNLPERLYCYHDTPQVKSVRVSHTKFHKKF